MPKIYADFHNADVSGRLRMNCVGTLEDLARQAIELRPGMQLLLYSDDLDEHGTPAELVVEGRVEYSDHEACWVAVIDWDRIRHESDDGTAIPRARSG